MSGVVRYRSSIASVFWAAVACVVIVVLVRIGIPTNTDVRVHPWRYDPIDANAPFVPVRIGPDKPIVVELSVDGPELSRVEVFTERIGGAKLDVRFSDARSGSLLASTTDHPLAADGITTITAPSLRGVRRLRLILRSHDGEIELRGLERARPGVSVSTSDPRVVDVALRTYATVPSPWSRLHLAAERTLLRWPAWNQWLIPLGAVALLAAASVAAGWCARLAMPTGTSHADLGMTIIVGIIVFAPLIAMILRLR